ncbi:MAG: hypothetical protein K2X81_03615 [Candidatus Obscuribacterales bacterium]|nr:hypothetical protein [Candidatus Obscuribacterales bacterium]
MIRRIQKSASEHDSKPKLKLVGGSGIIGVETEAESDSKAIACESVCKDGICTLNWKPQRPAIIPLGRNESAA